MKIEATGVVEGSSVRKGNKFCAPEYKIYGPCFVVGIAECGHFEFPVIESFYQEVKSLGVEPKIKITIEIIKP